MLTGILLSLLVGAGGGWVVAWCVGIVTAALGQSGYPGAVPRWDPAFATGVANVGGLASGALLGFLSYTTWFIDRPLPVIASALPRLLAASVAGGCVGALGGLPLGAITALSALLRAARRYAAAP
jgi:hypothetical protein